VCFLLKEIEEIVSDPLLLLLQKGFLAGSIIASRSWLLGRGKRLRKLLQILVKINYDLIIQM